MTIRSVAILLFSACLAATSCASGDGLVGPGFSTDVHGSTFHPAAGPVAGGTPITITGRNFAPGVRVFFGDQEATAVAVQDENTLVATTPPGDFGPVPVELRAARSSSVLPEPFRYRAERLDFGFVEQLGRVGYDAGFGAGDFDGDGRTDVAVASQGRLRLYLATDEGFTLAATADLPPAMNFGNNFCTTLGLPYLAGKQSAFKYTIRMVDPDGNGRADILVSSPQEQLLYLFPGNAAGTLQAAVQDRPGALEPCANRYLEIGDFDGDETLDLLVLNHSGDVTSDGAFPELVDTLAVILAFGTARETTVYLPLALDTVGCPLLHDYRLEQQDERTTLRMMCGRPDGSGNQALYLTRVALTQAALTLKDEGTLAAAVPEHRRYRWPGTDALGNPYLVWLESLDTPGTWSNALTLGFGWLFLETTIMTFWEQPYRCLAPVPLPSLFGQGQGLAPVILCPDSNNVDVLDPGPSIYAGSARLLELGTPAGPNWTATTATGMPLKPSLGAADLDGDGWTDLILPEAATGQARLVHPFLAISKYSDSLSFRSNPPILDCPTCSYFKPTPAGLARQLHDLDHDGRSDLVVRNAFLSGQLTIALRSGVDSFQPPQLVQVPVDTTFDYTFMPGDLDGDGWDDLLLPGSYYHMQLAVILSNGGQYTYAGTYPISYRELEGLVLLGTSKSGDTQLLGWQYLPAESVDTSIHVGLTIIEGTLDGGFQELHGTQLIAPERILTLADLNLDGSPDLLTVGGQVCWGPDHQGGFEPLFSPDWAPAGTLSLGTWARGGTVDLVLFDEFAGRGEWVSFSGDARTRRRFFFDGAIEHRGFPIYSMPTCDVDGDGRGEVLFLGLLANQDRWAIAGLFATADPETAEVRPLGYPETSVYDIACEDTLGRGIEDLITFDSDALYLVPNHSR